MRADKKYMVILALTAIFSVVPTLLSAQHYLGVRAGYGGGSGGRFYPKSTESGTLWGLYHGGVSWKYYTKERFVGGTEVDVLYMQQGFKQYSPQYSLPYDPPVFDPNTGDVINPGDSTGYYSRKVNSVMVPLMWQPHVYLFNRNMRVFLNAGVTFSYNISSTYEQGSDLVGGAITDGSGKELKGKYPMKLVRDNRFGYGLVGGGGLGYSIGRIEVLAEVRYYIGYSDIKKNRNKYWDNDEPLMNRLRTPVDGLQGSVGIYYRFGKKGILSPASAKVEQKLRERDERRAMRQQDYLPAGVDEGIEIGSELSDDTGASPQTEEEERAPVPVPALPDSIPENSPDDYIPETGETEGERP